MAQGGENVVIAVSDCSITVLPMFGGKIASLRAGGCELMQAPLRPYGPRNHAMSFEQADASGWDECLPSVAACAVTTGAGMAAIPDHGDLWRVPWQVLAATADSVTMRARCFSLPLELTRTIILAEAASGWRMHSLYSLANLGTDRVPWAWAAHPLFSCAPGDRIVLPAEVEWLRLEGSRGDRLGVRGDKAAWPLARIADGSQYDLSKAQVEDAGIGDKLFAGPMREGWCSLERASVGLRITVRFDPAVTPYLGLWLCYGGWPEGDGPKQVCIAPEPSTAPVDSLAETGAWSRWLDGGETVSWPMDVDLDRMAAETPGHAG